MGVATDEGSHAIFSRYDLDISILHNKIEYRRILIFFFNITLFFDSFMCVQ